MSGRSKAPNRFLQSGMTTQICPTRIVATRYPFESRFIEFDDNLVHDIDEGQGLLLVCLHGNPTWTFIFRGVSTAPRNRDRCAALDYPGFGLSRARPGYGPLPGEHAPVVAAFPEARDLNHVTLVVQDRGGPIGMWAALAEPEPSARLVTGNA